MPNQFFFSASDEMIGEGVNLIELRATDRGVESFLDFSILVDVKIPPSPVSAMIDKMCKGVTYTLSTGNDKGACTTTAAQKNVSANGTANCDDGGGNSAELNCDREAGDACVGSMGSGRCDIKK